MLRFLLNTLPNWLLLVTIVGSAVGVGLLAELWLRRRPRRDGNDDMLSLTFEFVGIAYAILVGFVIVSVWETQQEAHAAVQHEAATLEDMVAVERPLQGSGEEVHEAMEAYVRTTTEEEFGGSLEDGEQAEVAEDAADAILDAIVAIEPERDVDGELRSELIGEYTAFRDLRTERVALANQHIAGELWLLVLVSSLAVVLLVATFKGEGRWDVLATVFVSLTVGLVLYALVALSYPFSGDVSVDPAPLQGVLREISRVDS